MTLPESLYSLVLAIPLAGVAVFTLRFAPILFRRGELASAQAFVRGLCPWFYLYCMALILVALLLRWVMGAAWEVRLLSLSLLGFGVAALVAAPIGQRVASIARRRWQAWRHRVILLLNSVQMLLLSLLGYGWLQG